MASRRGRLRRLTVEGPRVAAGAAQAFMSSPRRWLPRGARARGRGRWELTLSLGPAHRDVVLDLGPVWRNGQTLSRACTWQATPERSDWLDAPAWLPCFHGTLVLSPDPGGAPALRLEGAYVPPFGSMGEAIDRIALGRLAHQSAREFLGALAVSLDEAAQTPRAASLPLRSAR